MKIVSKPPCLVDRKLLSPVMERDTVKSLNQMMTLVVNRDTVKPLAHHQAEHPHRRHRLRRADPVEALTSSSVNDALIGTQAQLQRVPLIGLTST